MTNAEKHQYIYEKTGVEPDWWHNSGYFNTHLSIDKKEESKPYYPAEQLWEILGKVHGGVEPALTYNMALHTALLDMVIWCIDEGHLEVLKND